MIHNRPTNRDIRRLERNVLHGLKRYGSAKAQAPVAPVVVAAASPSLSGLRKVYVALIVGATLGAAVGGAVGTIVAEMVR